MQGIDSNDKSITITLDELTTQEIPSFKAPNCLPTRLSPVQAS